LLDDASLTKSDKELEELKTQQMLKMHKENQAASGADSGNQTNSISDQDINKLEKTLKQPSGDDDDLLHFEEPSANQ
jgi:hypothetical protein